MATVQRRAVRPRGFGYRKPGGLYLVASGPAVDCALFPLPLQDSSTCGQGIKPAHGWTWIEPRKLLHVHCGAPDGYCRLCPMGGLRVERAGLIWIGEAYYPTIADYIREAVACGFSRRIHAVPQGFQIGKTWVLLAHRRAVQEPGQAPSPGIFTAFVPQRIEYIVRGNESKTELDQLAARGYMLVRVVKESRPLPTTSGEK